MSKDISNGYEAVAEEYLAVRSTNGRALIQKWAASLPRGGSVVDVGAGSGEPLTSALIDEGLTVYAIDASSKMVAEFRRRFPDVEVACEPVESSLFFGRTFDAVLAIGLIFLLPGDSQSEVISRISSALKPGGRFLFSAPYQNGTWNDILTGQPSFSLGDEEYRRVLISCRLKPIKVHYDESDNHYYEAEKY